MNLQKKFTPSFHITNLIISAKRTVGLNLCLFYNLCFPLYSQNIRSFQNVRMPKGHADEKLDCVMLDIL